MIRAAERKKSPGASSEVVRDINRRIVLNLVRTRHPVSRADLARISGLQRSTISLIIEQLIEENWVLEGSTGRLPRGRRPTFLELNNDRVIIAVDLRPVQTMVAVADANGRFTSRETIPTAADPEVAVQSLVECIQRVIGSSQGKKIEGVGISLPGRFDASSDRLVFAPNLAWRDVDIRKPIAEATGLEVVLENAANACVLAEVWFGRIQECRNLVVVTVSEGLGTGLLANGELVRGLKGMAGEFGHVPLDPGGPVCSCGSAGCWEVFASNRAALCYYAEAGGDASGLEFVGLIERAERGDGRAAKAIERMAQYLGRGMRMIVAGMAPERIVVVGDLTLAWPRFGPILDAEIRDQVLPGGCAPLLVPAYEDGMARLRGTVALVLQKHFGATVS